MPAVFAHHRSGTKTRRRLIGCFFFALVVLKAVDSVPYSAFSSERAMGYAASALRHLGIATGPWMMFAPEPVVDNSCLTAQIHLDPDREIKWTSPQWMDVGAVEKFFRFRELNYYLRLSIPMNRDAAEDFASYLAHTSNDDGASAVRVSLYCNGLKLVAPIEGEIPPPSEVTWVLYSKSLASVESSP